MKVTIQYQVCNAKGQVIVKEKTFASEEAMQKWVTKQEQENDSFVGVIAYAYESEAK